MPRSDPRWGIVGLLGGTALVLLALVALARYPSLLTRGREYRAVFQNVAGLNLGDEVRYGGLMVGSVTGMQLDRDDPTRIVVRFKVSRRTPIRTDTEAGITQVGLLGEPFLSLSPGSRDAEVLPPGSTLSSRESLSFQDAMNRLAMFLDRADTLLGGMERLAGSSPWDRVDRTFDRFEALLVTTTTGSERVLTQLDVASARLGAVLAHSERVLTGIDSAVAVVGPGLNETQREALAAMREARTLLADIHDAMEAGGGVDHLVRNMNQAAENMARLTARLERDPTSVLQRRSAPRKTVGPPVRHD